MRKYVFYSTEYLGQFFFKLGYSISYKFIDRGIFEIFGPTGISNVTSKISLNIHKLQSGYIYHYTLCGLSKYLDWI